MPKLTKLGIADFCYVLVAAIVVTIILVFGKPSVDASIVPTVLNGVSTVTGIVTAITSSVIVYTLSVRAQARALV